MKSLNINIGTVMKSPEMSELVPDHLKTKKICKFVVKELPYLLKMFLTNIRLNKCVIKLFQKILEH